MKKLTLLCLLIFTLAGAQVTMQTVRDMAPNTWLQVPNSHLETVFPDYQWTWDNGVYGVTGPGSVIGAWGGGAYDTKRDRLILWGGGHNNYRGNEIYLFDVATLKWIRYTDPTPHPVDCGQVNSDGTPNSRHTYGGLEYITHADRFFASGGALNCNSGGCGADKTWTFDFDAKQWTDRLPTGTKPPTACEDACAYDPNSKRLYWSDNNYAGNGRGVYSYDFDTNVWTRHNGTGHYAQTAVVDPKRKLLFFIGAGIVHVYDIGNNNYADQSWTTTGGSSVVGANDPGLAYDPVLDRVVAWNGGSVYALNPDTKAWTAYNAANAPTPASVGTYGRWRYVPSVNAFINVNDHQQNVYFYKLTAGTGTGLTSPNRAVADNDIRISPNPFASAARISLGNGRGGKIQILNLQGKLISTLCNDPGKDILWDASGLAPGIYLLKTAVRGKIQTVKLFRQ